MRSISISLDGLQENHEWLRQVKGSFESTVKGIKALKKIGFPVQVTNVINKHNFSELEEMYMLMKNLNLDSWRVINVDPIGRANDEDGLFLSKEEIKKLLEFIREKRFDNSNQMDVTYGCSHYVSYDLENEIRDSYFLCTSGIYIASLLVSSMRLLQ